MSTYWVFVQAIGLLAMFFDVYATTHKNDKKLIIFNTLGNFTFSLHFLLLGALPGAASEFIGGLRAFLSLFLKEQKTGRYISFIFILFYVVMMFVTVNTAIDTLPLLSGICITIALYFLSGIQMRLCFFISILLWMIYAIYTISVGGIILCSIMLCTTSITIIRLLREKTA